MIQSAKILCHRNIVLDTIWSPILDAGSGPKYIALARLLRDAIRTGDLAKGAQLPTVRDLAYQLKVTPGTVARAYQIVTAEGLLQATVGRGTFVAAQHPQLGPRLGRDVERLSAATSDVVDLQSPKLPDIGQTEVFSAILSRQSQSVGRDWLDYTRQSTEAPLRDAVVQWLAPRILGPFDGGDVMLSLGGQNSVNLVMNCCLRGDRPVVLTEELAYPGFRYAARLARAEVVGVEMDDQGVVPQALEAACKRYGPQILCLTPEIQNPTGARMSLERRQQIVALARRYDLQIIEDNCYVPRQNDLPTLRALAPERVWFLGSLSKSISPALRFGYAICPTGMGEAGRLTAQHSFFALPLPLTSLVLDLLQSGAAEALFQRVQEALDQRVQIFVNRLGSFDLRWQPGMPFAFLNLPMGWRASSFARASEEAGVLIRSADQYALIHGRAPNSVRLAMACNRSLEDFDRALVTLAGLLTKPPSDMAV
jgi:DNA-binding transcriptional MocR family regulator